MDNATQRIADLERAVKLLSDAVLNYCHTLGSYGYATIETDHAYQDMSAAQIKAMAVFTETEDVRR